MTDIALIKVVNGEEVRLTRSELRARTVESDTRLAEKQDREKKFGYRARRVKDYPAIAEQLDDLWHAMDTGEIPKATAWYEKIKTVKERHAKPAE